MISRYSVLHHCHLVFSDFGLNLLAAAVLEGEGDIQLLACNQWLCQHHQHDVQAPGF